MNAIISYQTVHLPPPFAFAYTLELDVKKNSLAVKYQLEYLNRDSLSEEEILEEGYSPDDDFQWNGELDNVWSMYIKPELQKIKTGQPKENDPIWIHAKTDQVEGNLKDLEQWDFLLQELIQAIYEQSGYEKPLKLKIITRERGRSEFYEIDGQFTTRSALINGKPIAWDVLQTLLSTIYTVEFDEEADPVKEPAGDGLWIDLYGQSTYIFAGKLNQKSSVNIIKSIQAV